MKSLTQNSILLLTILSSLFILNGCTSQQGISQQRIVQGITSPQVNNEEHLYNNKFGLIPSNEVDQTIEKNIAYSQIPETDTSMLSDDPSLTTELVPDPDAVTLENYVETPPVITYKYMDSPKFYTEDELPKNKLITRD